MNERPIIFSAPMVRALLEGRKTQTRRLCKQDGCMGCNHPGNILMCWNENGRCSTCDGTGHQPPEDGDPCPYGVPGDRLWVREKWRATGNGQRIENGVIRDRPQTRSEIVYAADEAGDSGPWRPSIHMPRWASRITLEITGVRVERLNDITVHDVEAEGCSPDTDGSYQALWESINGRGSWSVNPWVWVIEFRRITL